MDSIGFSYQINKCWVGISLDEILPEDFEYDSFHIQASVETFVTISNLNKYKDKYGGRFEGFVSTKTLYIGAKIKTGETQVFGHTKLPDRFIMLYSKHRGTIDITFKNGRF